MKTVKKILIYSAHTETVGGDVKYIVDLINKLQIDGHNITVLLDRNSKFMDWAKNWLTHDLNVEYINTLPVLFEKNLFEKMMDLGLLSNFFRIKIKSHPISQYANFLYKIVTFYHLRLKVICSVSLFKKIKQHSPDIFWANNGGYPGKEAALISVLIAKYIFKIKTVLTIHSLPEKRLKIKPSEFFYDYLIKKIDSIITVSKILKTKIIQYRNFNEENIYTIYCGLVNESALSDEKKMQLKQSLKLPDGRYIILQVGGISEQKGHFFTLSALNILKQKISNFTLICVGEHNNDNLKKFQTKILELGLEENILILSKRFDIHSLNSISDISLTPSLYSEATPYTIKEASRAKIPSITTLSGGCPEAIINDETGFVLSSLDENIFAEKIEQLLTNKNLRLEMGYKAYEFYLQLFEMNSTYLQIQKILFDKNT